MFSLNSVTKNICRQKDSNLPTVGLETGILLQRPQDACERQDL